MKRWLLIALGPVLASIAAFLLNTQQAPSNEIWMLFVVVWVATWWLTEAVDLAVTSLLPFILMPILGIDTAENVAMQYMNQIIFLFIGGFFIAYAMEKWNLHERLAYRIILLTGNTPAKVLLGIMLTSFFLSMWVSNTATVMMLIAAVLSIVKQKDIYHESAHAGSATAMLIGLSFSATIGGMATPVGTPPNMIFMAMYEKAFPDNAPIDFIHWMMIGFPLAALMLAVAYFILRFLFIPGSKNFHFDMNLIEEKYKSLGEMKREEKQVAFIFLVTAMLWFFRQDLDFGFFSLTGWSKLFGPLAGHIKDSTVVMLTSFILFLMPAKGTSGNRTTLLEWKDAERMPLSVILLFGAGFAMADGFESSGLSTLAATQLYSLKGFPPLLILLGIAFTVTVLSEFASNTASVQLVLPVVIPLAQVLNMDPLVLMLTATFSASLGFMLPVATSASTIVYGTGEIKTKDMMKAGLLLDMVGILLLTLIMQTIGKFALN